MRKSQCVRDWSSDPDTREQEDKPPDSCFKSMWDRKDSPCGDSHQPSSQQSSENAVRHLCTHTKNCAKSRLRPVSFYHRYRCSKYRVLWASDRQYGQNPGPGTLDGAPGPRCPDCRHSRQISHLAHRPPASGGRTLQHRRASLLVACVQSTPSEFSLSS